MRQITIKLDVDGVLRDCVTPLLKEYNKKYGEDVKYEDVKGWDIGAYIPKDPHYAKYFTDYPEKIFRDAPMYNPRTAEILSKIQKHYKIHIVTHQFKGLEGHTVEWLHKNNIPYDAISFAKDKSSIDGMILVDDAIHNLEASNSNYNICFTQPWNTDYKGMRVDSLEGLANMLSVHSKEDLLE